MTKTEIRNKAKEIISKHKGFKYKNMYIEDGGATLAITSSEDVFYLHFNNGVLESIGYENFGGEFPWWIIQRNGFKTLLNELENNLTDIEEIE